MVATAEVSPDRDLMDGGMMDFTGDEPIAEPTSKDADAPYGRKPDGTPYKRRHGPRGPNSRTTGTRARSTGRGSLRTQIGGMLIFVNMPLSILTPKNALDAVEVDALAKAIDDECQRNARFRKYVEQMLAVQGGAGLAAVVVMIGARRVVRNNIVDVPKEMGGNESVDAMIGSLISMASGSGPINPNLRVMTEQEST